MRPVCLTPFQRSHDHKSFSLSTCWSFRPAKIRHHLSLQALPSGHKLDEQVARLENFFDASWEIHTPPTSETSTIGTYTAFKEVVDENEEENQEVPLQTVTSGTSVPDQLVEVQNFKDMGFHRMCEYSSQQAIRLKSSLRHIFHRPAYVPSKSGIDGAKVSSRGQPADAQRHNVVFSDRLFKDVAELSSTTKDVVSKNIDSFMSFGSQRIHAVTLYAKNVTEKYPTASEYVGWALTLTFYIWLTQRGIVWFKSVQKTQRDSKREQDIRRRKGQRQRKRFQNMLGSFDEGVDTSVFNAVKRIGENTTISHDDDGFEYDDLETVDDRVEGDTMTKEMQAAWKNFVKDSKLSEGEFWTKDNIDQGLAKIEIQFDPDRISSDFGNAYHSSDDIDNDGMDVGLDADSDVDE